ncbi:hypothetical protein AXG93_3825s1120 [Marchantia polymorpha subsp. ruderalis]|uniref:Uncharacterized protein n=1 Tax=Marchantia polymorpha subsp. ruderalis TaxID=1480154 RepID=A0A176W9Z6_MARPO|nr:hypothetical protein AXG93_3825s1120 [Marchantia polymorpha subsp. ruderalis]
MGLLTAAEQKKLPLLTHAEYGDENLGANELDSKLEKYVGPSNVRSYVELVRNRTRVKMAATTVTAKQKACDNLRADVETTRQETIDLRDRLGAFQVAFNEESRRVDELTADLAKRDQAHAVE